MFTYNCTESPFYKKDKAKWIKFAKSGHTGFGHKQRQYNFSYDIS